MDVRAPTPDLKERWHRARADLRAWWRERRLRSAERAALRGREPHMRGHWSDRFPYVPWWGAVTGVIVLALVLIIAFWDWNILRAPLERMASAALDRPVSIGNVDVRLNWTSRVTLDRVSIGNPDWAREQAGPDMARIDRIVADVQVLPLFTTGGLVMPQVDIQNPAVELMREKAGRANWDFGTGAGGDNPKLPLIGRLLIDNGRIHIRDEGHRLEFSGRVGSHTGPAWNTARAFELEGRGTIAGHPFTATMGGDSPLRADRTRPYDFNAHMVMGASRIEARGSIPRPFNLDAIVAHLDVTGDDLAHLYYLTGIVLPDTPAYHITGTLRREGDVWRFAPLRGTVGHSDLSGTLGFDTRNPRLFLTADLKSANADIDDLAALLGARPKAAAPSVKNANPHAAAAATVHAAAVPNTFMLPDSPLDVGRVRTMDARVHYTAHAIRSGSVPMRDLVLGVKLDHGVITIDPARVTLALGKVDARARIDARHDVPAVAANVALTGARLESLIHGGGSAIVGAEPLAGELQMHANLHGAGRSVHEAVANADGDIRLSIPHGEIRKAVAELLGINVINGLGLVLSGDESKTDLRCAVADFHAAHGALTVQRFVIDTGVVLATGTGQANLKSETMNLAINGHPKKFRIGRIMAPITVSGPWNSPHVGVDAGKAVAQAGIGAALGALVSPIAAAIPFISTGTAHDVDCAKLLAGGPSVKPATPD